MHATVRRVQVRPGTAAEVGALIQAEYVPIVRGVAGFVSYSAVDAGGDVVTSVGIFTSLEAATAANELAKGWIGERLAPFVTAPPELVEGSVMVHELA